MTHISREIAPFKFVLGKRRDDHPTLSLNVLSLLDMPCLVTTKERTARPGVI